jgi:hypothetical protein
MLYLESSREQVCVCVCVCVLCAMSVRVCVCAAHVLPGGRGGAGFEKSGVYVPSNTKHQKFYTSSSIHTYVRM